jgi:hypothetical protein
MCSGGDAQWSDDRRLTTIRDPPLLTYTKHREAACRGGLPLSGRMGGAA